MRTWIAGLFLTLQLIGAGAWAQAPPGKVVRLVVPFPAGGATDVLAPLLSASMQRTVIVENNAGATGAFVARAAPDGDALLLSMSSVMAASAALPAKLAYDPIHDFAPISLIATIENVLVVHPGVPATTVRELIGHAKANPGRLSYATSGIGSTCHLGAELFAADFEKWNKVVQDADIKSE